MMECKIMEELFEFLIPILQHIFLAFLLYYHLAIFNMLLSIDFMEEEKPKVAFINIVSRSAKKS